jgi:hypothetical protein
VTVEYFMDKMQDWELVDIYENLGYANANLWEMTRWIMFVNAQVNTKKKLKLDDILRFPWDGDTKSSKMTEADITRLKQMANNYNNYINGSKFKDNNNS